MRHGTACLIGVCGSTGRVVVVGLGDVVRPEGWSAIAYAGADSGRLERMGGSDEKYYPRLKARRHCRRPRNCSPCS